MKTATSKTCLIPLLSLSLLAVPMLSSQTNPATSPPTQGTHVCTGNEEPKSWHHRWGTGFANLTAVERQQLKADFAQIKENPQLVAARQAVKDAQTPEAKKEARYNLHQTRQQLLIQVDPSAQSILDKLQQSTNSLSTN